MMSYLTFNGFTYFEKLEDTYLDELPQSLILSSNSTSESILFRLLLGTLDLKLNTDDLILKQNICYNKIRENFLETDVSKSITTWIKTNEFGLGDIDHYFNFNKKNKTLFDELLTEFSFFFIYKSNSNNISAFLHLYRALEFMSFSFPMTYSSMTTNFYTSFDTFKGFFTSKDQGQLKFFKEFINVLFEEYVLRCRTKIDTYVGDDLLDKSKRKVIYKLCNNLDLYDDGMVFSIQYENLLDFMINLRNKYFHFESDRKDNISNINFNSELFFEALNDKFANWLSMIYLEILIHGVYKLNLLPVN